MLAKYLFYGMTCKLKNTTQNIVLINNLFSLKVQS